MDKTLRNLKILQIAVDGLLILGAFALAYFLRIGFFFSSDFPFRPYFMVAAAATPVAMLFLFFIRAYKLNQQILSWRHAQRIGFVAIQTVAVFMVLYYFAYHNFFSRLILVYIFGLVFALVYGWHVLFRWILSKHFEREVGVYRTLVIGANRPAQDIVKMLITERSHVMPVAVIDPYGLQKNPVHGVPVVGKMNLFEKTIADHDIDLILQVDHLEQSLNVINYALQNHIKYLMPPELLGIFQGHQSLEEIEGVPFLKVDPKRPWWTSLW